MAAEERHDEHGQGEHHDHHEHPEHHHGPPHEIIFHIDHKKYETTKHEMTGTEIRALAKPPITSAYDLYLETRGPGDDELVGDDTKVRIRSDDSFYSVLKQVNPGASDEVA